MTVPRIRSSASEGAFSKSTNLSVALETADSSLLVSVCKRVKDKHNIYSHTKPGLGLYRDLKRKALSWKHIPNQGSLKVGNVCSSY